MADKFKLGDIVQLKSGGPKMTVTETNALSGASIRTAWFAGSKHETGYFPIEALVVPSEKEKDK